MGSLRRRIVRVLDGKRPRRAESLLALAHDDSTVSPNDYLALALVALAYVITEAIQGYGFLAVFAAGIGLRQAEVLTAVSPSDPAAEHLVQPVVGHQHVAPELAVKGDVAELDDSRVAAGIMLGDMLAFGSLVERAMEVFLVTLLGVVLLVHWDWQGLIVAGALFCIIRPLSVFLTPFAPRFGCSSARTSGLVRYQGNRQPVLSLLRDKSRASPECCSAE